MPQYFAVGGSFETETQRNFIQIERLWDKIDEQFVPWVLFRSFGTRLHRSEPIIKGIRLFVTEQEAMEFAQKKEKEQNSSKKDGTICYPYFLVETKKKWDKLQVPFSEIKHFYHDTTIIKSSINGYSDYNDTKSPQELVEEARRPLLDLSWWLVFIFSFFTVIVPIFYTLYRQSIKENALKLLEYQGVNSMSRSYRNEITKLEHYPNYLEMDMCSDEHLKSKNENTFIDTNYPGVFVSKSKENKINGSSAETSINVHSEITIENKGI
ncbi:MAG: hypothetical protein H0T84_03520 [Tatlockia sp.]|nr:hypothetical protein [Tatlockia sp.]